MKEGLNGVAPLFFEADLTLVAKCHWISLAISEDHVFTPSKRLVSSSCRFIKPFTGVVADRFPA
jgi:hypothetical protein